MRDLAFTVYSDATFESGEVLMTVRITSENGESQDVEITIESARISLSFDDDKTLSKSNSFADVDPNIVVIVIENSGLRTASEVTVFLTPSGGQEENRTLSVPALGSQDFQFNLSAASQGIERFDVRVEVGGDDANFTTGELPNEDFRIEYIVQGSDEEDSSLILVAIVALIIIILYFGIKAARSRGGSGTRF